MLKNTLPPVNQYTPFDAYSVDVDNRPILDLQARDKMICDELDRRTGLLVVSSEGIVLRAEGCLESSNCTHDSDGVFSVTVNTSNTTFGVTVSVESTTPIVSTYSNKALTGFKVRLFSPTFVPIDAPFTVRVAL